MVQLDEKKPPDKDDQYIPDELILKKIGKNRRFFFLLVVPKIQAVPASHILQAGGLVSSRGREFDEME